MSVNAAVSNQDRRVVYGDWQTPLDLAQIVCRFVHSKFDPEIIIEPNCGYGTFVSSALAEFSDSSAVWGGDINGDYLEKIAPHPSLTLRRADFFDGDWKEFIEENKRILLLGNPPWVTVSELSRRDSDNCPRKNNEIRFSGLEAVTGKSNFDISQWMIQEEVKVLQGKIACLAMLCKSSTARRILEYIWNQKLKCTSFAIYPFDAKMYFGVSVDAVLLLITFNPQTDSQNVTGILYRSLEEPNKAELLLGCFHRRLVSNISVVKNYSALIGQPQKNVWRSGVKHDCAKVMELCRKPSGEYQNGLGVTVSLEEELLFPLLKSSDVGNRRTAQTDRFLLVTQKKIGQETLSLRLRAPKIWQYLYDYRSFFESRKSTVYRNSPSFSIFGVGDYTFKPWKIAVSGLYKNLAFNLIGPIGGKPVLFDDTCYFLAFDTEEQAEFINTILQTDLAQEIFQGFIFWDAKRPITAGLLNLLNLELTAAYLGKEEEYRKLFPEEKAAQRLFSFA